MYRYSEAPLITDYLKLEVRALSSPLNALLQEPGPASGTLSIEQLSVDFLLSPVGEHPTRTLVLELDEEHKQVIQLQRVNRSDGRVLGWKALCPLEGCRKGGYSLYWMPEALCFACQTCCGLVYASNRNQTSMVDRARRDPKAFVLERQDLETPREVWFTMRTLMTLDIEQQRKAARRGYVPARAVSDVYSEIADDERKKLRKFDQTMKLWKRLKQEEARRNRNVAAPTDSVNAPGC